jgi:hypothetical protein
MDRGLTAQTFFFGDNRGELICRAEPCLLTGPTEKVRRVISLS